MARMTTARPAQKVTASALASACAVVAIWALEEFVGIVMPTAVQPAFTLIVTFAVGYIVPPAARDQVREA